MKNDSNFEVIVINENESYHASQSVWRRVLYKMLSNSLAIHYHCLPVNVNKAYYFWCVMSAHILYDLLGTHHKI